MSNFFRILDPVCIAAAQRAMGLVSEAEDLQIVSIEASVAFGSDEITVDAVVKHAGDWGKFDPISLDGPDGFGQSETWVTYNEECRRYRKRIGDHDGDPVVTITIHRQLFKD